MREIVEIAATFGYQQSVAATFDYQQAIALAVDTYPATIRDNFAVAVAVGVVDGSSASVGPGTRTVVDTDGLIGIAESLGDITYDWDSWTLQDTFSTALSAGNVDGTSGDTGTRAVVDTESKVSIGA